MRKALQMPFINSYADFRQKKRKKIEEQQPGGPPPVIGGRKYMED